MIGLPALILSIVTSLCTYIIADKVKTPPIESIRSQVEESIFIVRSSDNYGTGFVVQAKSGKLVTVTAGHVCGPRKIGIYHKEGKKEQTLVVIKAWDQADLCILTAPVGVKPISLGQLPAARDRVYRISYASTYWLNQSDGEYLGPVKYNIDTDWALCLPPYQYLKEIEEDGKKEMRCFMNNTYLLSTNMIDHGGSGGPLLNSSGQVIGVTTLVMGGMSYTASVPITQLSKLLNLY